MSLRGEITIECDVKDCHAEEVIPVQIVIDRGVLVHLGYRALVFQVPAMHR